MKIDFLGLQVRELSLLHKRLNIVKLFVIWNNFLCWRPFNHPAYHYIMETRFLQLLLYFRLGSRSGNDTFMCLIRGFVVMAAYISKSTHFSEDAYITKVVYKILMWGKDNRRNNEENNHSPCTLLRLVLVFIKFSLLEPDRDDLF